MIDLKSCDTCDREASQLSSPFLNLLILKPLRPLKVYTLAILKAQNGRLKSFHYRIQRLALMRLHY